MVSTQMGDQMGAIFVFINFEDLFSQSVESNTYDKICKTI